MVLGSAISIHAPREGSDSAIPAGAESASLFQSTLPVRGATKRHPELWVCQGYFNPRSP